METPKSLIEELYEKVEDYSLTTIELAKLKGLQTTSTVITTLIAKMGVVIIVSLFMIMMSIGAALWLGEILGKLYYGFFVLGGFYLIMSIISYFLLFHLLKRPISSIMIKQVLN